MAALILALSGVLAQPAPSSDIARWASLIDRASTRFAVPAGWIRQVMRAESGGRSAVNGRPIRSPAGAIGLMQLMPGTWAAMRTAHGLGPDPDDPRDNILAGTAYLRLLYDRFGYPGLFAAYNAGPTRYAAYLRGESGLPVETRTYLATVTHEAGRSGTRYQADRTPPPLFALRHDRGETSVPSSDRAQPASLFVALEASR